MPHAPSVSVAAPDIANRSGDRPGTADSGTYVLVDGGNLVTDVRLMAARLRADAAFAGRIAVYADAQLAHMDRHRQLSHRLSDAGTFCVAAIIGAGDGITRQQLIALLERTEIASRNRVRAIVAGLIAGGCVDETAIAADRRCRRLAATPRLSAFLDSWHAANIAAIADLQPAGQAQPCSAAEFLAAALQLQEGAPALHDDHPLIADILARAGGHAALMEMARGLAGGQPVRLSRRALARGTGHARSTFGRLLAHWAHRGLVIAAGPTRLSATSELQTAVGDWIATTLAWSIIVSHRALCLSTGHRPAHPATRAARTHP